MEILEATAVISSGETQTKKYSAPVRLWHWLNAVVISGSLLTVLINSTVLKPWTSAGVIAGKLKEKGVNVSDDQTRSAAFALADRVWAIHTWFGYTLIALLLFRIVLEFFELTDQKLLRKIRSARQAFRKRQEDRIAARNEMLIKTLYALFYVFILTMAVTGLCLAFEDDVPALRSMHFIREIHQFTMYLILGFIVIHLAGVFLGERKRHKGIVSDMINGGKA
ncbi:MAG: cytochrome b/b6 domain-containing protein [Bacteroidetes bacterium]|nr:cytochrome b/b6 domain-containing protein [Bacteroidota bacterium]